MNLSTLDVTLRKLSESELKYKSGHIFDGWSKLKKISIHGRDVYQINQDFSNMNYFDKRDSFSFNHNLSIKRNSRFNPIPEHTHTHLELNYVYSGTCPQKIDGQKITLMKNQVLLIDSECPHSIDSLNDDDIMISVTIRKEFLREHLFSQFSKGSILSHFFINAIIEKTDHNRYLLFNSEKNRRIPLFFQELFCELYDPSINSNDVIIHLFYIIMVELINVHENDMVHNSKETTLPRIASIIRYIEKNHLTCTQESVAEFFQISPNYVSTLLKKHLGLSYIQLLQEQKLNTSAALLRNTNQPITEIAHEVGYENVSYFYKKFYKKYGCSPKEYRINTNGVFEFD